MNPLFRIPIRLQLVIIVAIVALPAAGIIFSSGVQQRNRAIREAQMDTRRLVDRIASEQQIVAASARQLVASLAQLPEVQEKDAAKTNLLLYKIQKLNAKYTGIVIADVTGNVWASSAPFKKPISISDRKAFKNALASGQLSSGEFQIGPTSLKQNLDFGYPYKDSQGRIVGVITLGIDLQYYQTLLQRTQLPDNANMALIDHRGVILFGAAAPEKFIGNVVNPNLFKTMLEGPDADTSIAVGIAVGAQQERYISYQKLRLEGEQMPYMYVKVGIPVESVLSQAKAQVFRNLSLFTFVLAIALFLAWLVGKRSIVDRIDLLKTASGALAEGALQVRVSELVKGGELGELGESFDAMAQQLALREISLVEKQRQLEELNASLEQRIADAVIDSRKKDQILIQQGRQAAMGEMIGNIAHQWRQPLNTLALIVQELRLTFGREEFNKERLDASVDKAMGLIFNMSKTIDDFRNYFKPDKEKKPFNVHRTLAKALLLVQSNLTGLNIDIRITVIEDADIVGYENEFSQVLLNILLNCRDAFETLGVERQRVISIAIFRENDRSVITIADNAGGIPEDVIGKIFDPYFTTKDASKGTGIGLYMAKNIIERNMEGRLSVRNTADGAEFRIEV